MLVVCSAAHCEVIFQNNTDRNRTIKLKGEFVSDVHMFTDFALDQTKPDFN